MLSAEESSNEPLQTASPFLCSTTYINCESLGSWRVSIQLWKWEFSSLSASSYYTEYAGKIYSFIFRHLGYVWEVASSHCLLFFFFRFGNWIVGARLQWAGGGMRISRRKMQIWNGIQIGHGVICLFNQMKGKLKGIGHLKATSLHIHGLGRLLTRGKGENNPFQCLLLLDVLLNTWRYMPPQLVEFKYLFYNLSVERTAFLRTLCQDFT